MIMIKQIKIVIQRFTVRMILTTLDGNQSKTMVLKSTLTKNMAIIVIMAKRIPAIPDTRDPVRSGRHRQQDCTIGPAIVGDS